MTQRLFRVYFSTAPHVPAHSYRHVWANDLDHATQLVEALIVEKQPALDAVDFHLTSIREEEIHLFDAYLRDLREAG